MKVRDVTGLSLLAVGYITFFSVEEAIAMRWGSIQAPYLHSSAFF